MGARILSKLEKTPSSYSMIGEEPLSEGIIIKEDLYKSKLGFRNIVVYGYLKIDIAKLRKSLKKVDATIFIIGLKFYESANKASL